MKHKMYCLKISQKMLHLPNFDYWPYDRMYLIHIDDFHVAPLMYRYYFHMPLTPKLLEVLNRIEIEAHREITVSRNDAKFNYIKGKSAGQFQWIDNPNEWRIISPTHVRGKYKNSKAVASLLEYVTTSAIQSHNHNEKIELPQIALHTPKREIGFFCAICANLPQFHEGKCRPGTHQCKLKIDTELPFDDHFRRALKKSAEEAGGD